MHHKTTIFDVNLSLKGSGQWHEKTSLLPEKKKYTTFFSELTGTLFDNGFYPTVGSSKFPVNRSYSEANAGFTDITTFYQWQPYICFPHQQQCCQSSWLNRMIGLLLKGQKFLKDIILKYLAASTKSFDGNTLVMHFCTLAVYVYSL